MVFVFFFRDGSGVGFWSSGMDRVYKDMTSVRFCRALIGVLFWRSYLCRRSVSGRFFSGFVVGCFF